ncbi:MAG: bifunctional folylpolyglutamate synthase/dihydrofolate synthase [Ilumatobacteraceae bacterium]
MQYAEALRYLDEHASYEKTGRVESPSLGNITRLMDLMANPQFSYPVIHVTGTNGKGSTTQIITRLLMAHGLNVGTYTSPHLERLNERISYNGIPINDDDFGTNVGAIADIEVLAGVRPSYFEIMTAAAFRYFADSAIDVAVIEVGMLGRWDATNVVNADVAVITNIALDHIEFAGPSLGDIAREKVGITKVNSSLVVGDANPDLRAVWNSAGAARVLLRGDDFDCLDNQLAVGGRLIDVRTPRGVYVELALPLNGRHQGDNASIALMAVEEFFDAPLSRDIIFEGFANVEMPGRFEVMSRQPLVIIDGAHNPAGADVCAQVFFDDFDPQGGRILVVGMLKGREPGSMLSALRADDFDLVVCCTAPSPRGLSAGIVADAAHAMGCEDVETVDSVEQACEHALRFAKKDDAVLVAGSLYVVGAARTYLRNTSSI